MPLGAVNAVSLALFGIACAAIGLLALAASRRPRLPQLCFLVIAAFLLFNKVWSPQYVIWLAPLAVLAGRQLTEVAYFLGIWAYLITIIDGPSAAGGIGASQYFLVLLGRFIAVALLSGLVVRDILRPAADLVRRDGEDDPAGGILDGAQDRFVLRFSAGLRPAQPAARARRVV